MFSPSSEPSQLPTLSLISKCQHTIHRKAYYLELLEATPIRIPEEFFFFTSKQKANLLLIILYYCYIHVYTCLHVICICAFVSCRTHLSWMKKVTALDLRNQAISFLCKCFKCVFSEEPIRYIQVSQRCEIARAALLSLRDE